MLQVTLVVDFVAAITDATDQSNAVYELVGDLVEDLLEPVRNKLDPLLRDLIDILRGLLADGLDWFEEKVALGLAFVADNAAQLADKAEAYIRRELSGLLSVLQDKLALFVEYLEYADAGVEVLEALGKGVRDFAGMLKDVGFGKFLYNIGNGMLTVAGILANVLEKAREYAAVGAKILDVDTLVEMLHDTVDTVVDGLSTGVDKVLNFTRTSLNDLLDSGEAFVFRMLDTLEGKLADAISSLILKIMDKVLCQPHTLSSLPVASPPSTMGHVLSQVTWLVPFIDRVGDQVVNVLEITERATDVVNIRSWLQGRADDLLTVEGYANDAMDDLETFVNNSLAPALNLTGLVGVYIDTYESTILDLQQMADEVPALLEEYKEQGCLPDALCLREVLLEKTTQLIALGRLVAQGIDKLAEFGRWISNPGDAWNDIKDLLAPTIKNVFTQVREFGEDLVAHLDPSALLSAIGFRRRATGTGRELSLIDHLGDETSTFRTVTHLTNRCPLCPPLPHVSSLKHT